MFDQWGISRRLLSKVISTQFQAQAQATKPVSRPPQPLPPNSTTIFQGGLDTMPFLLQGKESACGTTSLAMILDFLGKPTDRTDIDHEIRRLDVYTSPGDLVQYARDRGVEAQLYNKGSWDELKGYVDQGIPTQVLFSPDGSGDLGKLHYVAVVGFVTDPATGEEAILYHDSNRSDLQRMSRAEFERKWQAPDAGFDNFFIAYAPKGTYLPPRRDDGIEGTLAAAEGGANFLNGVDRVFDPDSPAGMLHGLVQMGAGAGQFVGGAVGGYLQAAGRDSRDLVEGIPVFEQIFQPVGHLIEGVGAMTADLVDGVAEAGQDLGEGIDKLGKGDVIGFGVEVGEATVEVLEGAGSAIGDGFKSVGRAVGDFFDW